MPAVCFPNELTLHPQYAARHDPPVPLVYEKGFLQNVLTVGKSCLIGVTRKRPI